MKQFDMIASEFDHADRFAGGQQSNALISVSSSKDYDGFGLLMPDTCPQRYGPFEAVNEKGNRIYVRMVVYGSNSKISKKFEELSEKAIEVLGDIDVTPIRFEKKTPPVIRWAGFLLIQLQRRKSEFVSRAENEFHSYMFDTVYMPLYASSWLIRQIKLEQRTSAVTDRQDVDQMKKSEGGGNDSRIVINNAPLMQNDIDVKETITREENQSKWHYWVRILVAAIPAIGLIIVALINGWFKYFLS